MINNLYYNYFRKHTFTEDRKYQPEGEGAEIIHFSPVVGVYIRLMKKFSSDLINMI